MSKQEEAWKEYFNFFGYTDREQNLQNAAIKDFKSSLKQKIEEEKLIHQEVVDNPSKYCAEDITSARRIINRLRWFLTLIDSVEPKI